VSSSVVYLIRRARLRISRHGEGRHSLKLRLRGSGRWHDYDSQTRSSDPLRAEDDLLYTNGPEEVPGVILHKKPRSADAQLSVDTRLKRRQVNRLSANSGITRTEPTTPT
jgi:hypothetical protein